MVELLLLRMILYFFGIWNRVVSCLCMLLMRFFIGVWWCEVLRIDVFEEISVLSCVGCIFEGL